MQFATLIFALLVATGAAARSETEARAWLRLHSGAPDEMAELKAANPEAYAIVNALLMKKSMGLLKTHHSTAPAETSDDTQEAQPSDAQQNSPYPEVAQSHTNNFNFRPASAANDEAMVASVLGMVGGGAANLRGKAPAAEAADSLSTDASSMGVADTAAPAPQVQAPVVQSAASEEEAEQRFVNSAPAPVALSAAPVDEPAPQAQSAQPTSTGGGNWLAWKPHSTDDDQAVASIVAEQPAFAAAAPTAPAQSDASDQLAAPSSWGNLDKQMSTSGFAAPASQPVVEFAAPAPQPVVESSEQSSASLFSRGASVAQGYQAAPAVEAEVAVEAPVTEEAPAPVMQQAQQPAAAANGLDSTVTKMLDMVANMAPDAKSRAALLKRKEHLTMGSTSADDSVFGNPLGVTKQALVAQKAQMSQEEAQERKVLQWHEIGTNPAAVAPPAEAPQRRAAHNSYDFMNNFGHAAASQPAQPMAQRAPPRKKSGGWDFMKNFGGMN